MAALSRITNGEHKDIKICPGDTVVFSSSAIPGNGIMIDHMVNQLTRSGAEVITNSILNDIHSSGHPSKQELRLVLKLVKPKYFMPMHGEHRMLRLHAELATTVGVPANNTFVLDNGESLVLARHKVSLGYQVEHGVTYIDGHDINGLAQAVLEDRIALSQDGMMAIAIAIDSKTNELLLDPIFYNKGVINQGNNQIAIECKELVTRAIKENLSTKTNFAELKNIIKTVAGNYLFSKINRRPMIIPVVMSRVEK